MKISGFNSITVGCICCIALMFAARFVDAQSEAKSFQFKQAEKQRITDQKELSDTANKNQVAQFDQLVITSYSLSKQPPNLDWKLSVDPAKKTFIYDKRRVCIGYALEGKLHFINTENTACNR